MASVKVQALILTYVLMAVILHPLLCRSSSTATTIVVEAMTSNGKTIDEGVAYMLMILALMVTYAHDSGLCYNDAAKTIDQEVAYMHEAASADT